MSSYRNTHLIKKFLIFVIIIFSIGCEGGSWKDFFTLDSVKTVRGDSIEELEEKAKKYESQLNKKIEYADRLGVIYQKLGDKYLDRRTWTSAIESYIKAIGYGRDSSIIHYSIAIAYANRGKEIASKNDIDKAEYHYKRAIEISPDFYDASYGLGILYAYLKNDKEKGLGIMEDLAARNKNYYIARFAIGRLYYELGNPGKSLSIYEDLFSDLKKQRSSPQIDEYLNNCKMNIERLMMELASKK